MLLCYLSSTDRPFVNDAKWDFDADATCLPMILMVFMLWSSRCFTLPPALLILHDELDFWEWGSSFSPFAFTGVLSDGR